MGMFPVCVGVFLFCFCITILMTAENQEAGVGKCLLDELNVVTPPLPVTENWTRTRTRGVHTTVELNVYYFFVCFMSSYVWR